MKLDSMKTKVEAGKAKAKQLGMRFTCAAGGVMCAVAANPALAMAAKTAGEEEIKKLTGALSTICVAGGILCVFAALVLFALGKVGDSNGARGEGMMVGLALAAVAFFIASVFINTALAGILG